jgi:hypothetical protein
MYFSCCCYRLQNCTRVVLRLQKLFSFHSNMMQSSSDDVREVEPLVSSSPAFLPVPARRKDKPFRRFRCFIPCLLIAVLALLSCVFLDKTAIVELTKRSRSFIRKNGDDVESNNLTVVQYQNDSTPDDQGMSIPVVSKDIEENSLSRPTTSWSPTHQHTASNNQPTASYKNNVDEINERTRDKKEDPSSDGPVVISVKSKENEQGDDNYNGNVVTNNSTEETSFEVETYKEHLVLHVGPQKTGSTTLQTAWYMPKGLSKVLKRDNYRYAFINPHLGYFNCKITDYGGYDDCEPSAMLRTLVRSAKESGQNLLLSDENLDAKFIRPLNLCIDRKHWHVTVIVVYRRIHEWLVSWYNQINKTTNRDVHGNILFDDYGVPYRMDHKWWPDQGGSEIPSFSAWYKSFTEHFDRSDLVSRHRSIELVKAYKPVFDKVVVHNMHQEGDLVTNFMCESLPGATNCCNKLKKGALQIPRENASIDLDHDIIAVGARKRGLLQKRSSRREVHDAVSRFVQRTGKAIPRKCDHEMIEEIRGWLLGSEKEMLSDSWTEQNTSELESNFDTYVAKGKLCDVDLSRLFEDIAWLEFFASLDNRPSLTLHVGPQRSGSTTLQQAWSSPNELADLLQQDHFSYQKITPERGMFECQVEGKMRYSNCKSTEKINTSSSRTRIWTSDMQKHSEKQ